MVSIPLLIKDDIERLGASTQIDSLSGSSMNQAFAAVTKEVVELLKQSHPLRANRMKRTETTTYGWSETIVIRAIGPVYKEVMAIEPLTTRELEVLQLIVEVTTIPQSLESFTSQGEL